MKVHLKALGCRLNEAELEQWSQQFRAEGHEIVPNAPDADVLVLNTCAVTHEASGKSRRLMHRLYRENPAAKLVVSGCYASLQADEVAQTLGVDLVVPNTEKDQLPQTVMQHFALPVMPAIASEPGESPLFLRGRHRAFIKIQDGCRYRCTFCIVTVARGDERSRTEADIILEINTLHQQGIQEVVLAGVHVGGYGSDTGTSLYALVQAILRETDMLRIRFASVEPWDLPDDFFALFTNPRLMPHMHLPLQSGADTVLRRMARRCKTAEFAQLVAEARRSVPGFNVTTDIIVGFPGETAEEWEQTLAYVESVGFGHLHIFTYSIRTGTKAAGLPNQVAEPLKKARSQTLHMLGERLKQQWLTQQVGHTVPVLWEYGRAGDAGQQIYTGYTPNYSKVTVAVANHEILENTIKPTMLTGVLEAGVLEGRV
ncbi:tRNA (N(6)-L-threonylcarbamoyladenosine(37)-C(2))-methylthiotransferase MtaB [Thiothrix subterranea]|uniref:tRNA (N(6)-L-threonylcarbamoyladenosine(37)-C(2))-methylthiotransferase MtaB n=1 Tax=Thiothrix subterranea TaxID=2735563 RepID=A0AA51QX37_9GAMM|nr:tRNA (N(6)-L-threonylcarbamoyladenosine(37)-C(2))-methylthiotransferase MtaB [Thiothrix subterranea]MDQ5770449.1 tRNA (N(6)-L-threonylcarbamoyladenosine(37)-C(2))-methylthiotransferase MtaB [Thiothrix subterranea]WML86873.1 tRNA (N(6)-L-threonylcarbamoyladenosine(37)-C(2))-methylthiotransferase MtaB [Thiothrix subterranea]